MNRFKFTLAAGMLAGLLFGPTGLMGQGILHAAATEAQISAPVNINQAGAEELQSIRGIGPALAERIMLYREEYGPFESAEELAQVRGIGGAKLEKIKEQVVV